MSIGVAFILRISGTLLGHVGPDNAAQAHILVKVQVVCVFVTAALLAARGSLVIDEFT